MMRAKRALARAVLLIGLLPAACSVPSGPMPGATATFPILPSATASRTPTLVVRASPSPTTKPLPTAAATATPPGFYNHYSAGFSFSYPANWEIQREGGNGLTLIDHSAGMVFIAFSQAEPQVLEMDDVIADLFQQAGSAPPDAQPATEMLLGGGVQAESARYVTREGDADVTWQVVYAHTGRRGYRFVAIAPSAAIEARQRTLEAIYRSVRFHPPEPFGLPYAEALTLLGPEPDAQDLDPALTTGSAADYVGLLYSGLVRINPQAGIAPDLAENWAISPDRLVYTFTLRPGLTFSSGKPLRAQDVKDSWERALDPATGSPTALAYLGEIVGARERAAGGAASIRGVSVIDERILQVTLTAPLPFFLARLATPPALVVDVLQAGIDAKNWAFKPHASGPFVLREYRKGEALILERNPRYHAPPALGYAVFYFGTGGDPTSLYEEGSIDILALRPVDAVRVRRTADPLHAEWRSTTSLCTQLVLFDPAQPPMDDPLVRKAFTQAVDRAGLVQQLTQGTGLAAAGILPPAMPGFSPSVIAAPYAEEDARAALAASRYSGNLPVVRLTAAGYADSEREDVRALVEGWRRVLGVSVQVEFIAPEGFTQAARERHGQMVFSGWCADYPEPENFLAFLFRSDSAFNLAGYRSPQVDAQLARAASLTPPESWTAYGAIERAVLDDYAAIPLYHPSIDVLVNPRVTGYTLTPLNIAVLQDVALQPGE